MRYISEIEYQKELARLNNDLKEAKNPNEKQKIQGDIAYLKRQRDESIRNEKFQAMQGRK